jgi:hypothetical protein
MCKAWGSWTFEEVRRSYDMSLWNCISGVWDCFSRFFILRWGDGSNVWFCYNIWCGDIALMDRYPELL